MTIRRILALDQATRTGWAFTDDLCESTLWSGTVDFSKEKDRPGRLRALGSWLDSKIRRVNPDLIVFERPNLGGRMGFHQAMQLMGYAAIIEAVASTHELAPISVHNATIKKHAGSGKFKKPDMVAAARARGWTIRSDDEADALFLCDYASKHLVREEVT